MRCALAGGVALSGAYLGHRLSKDIDLFFRDRAALRRLADTLADAARAAGLNKNEAVAEPEPPKADAPEAPAEPAPKKSKKKKQE